MKERIGVMGGGVMGAGKNPIVVKDAPTSWGYVSNRVYVAMVREAARVTRGAGSGWS